MPKETIDTLELDAKPDAKATAVNKLRGKNGATPTTKGRKKVTSEQYACWGMTKIDKDLAKRAKIACLNMEITQVEFAQQAFTHYLKHLKL